MLFPPTILLLDFKTFAQQKFKSLRTRAGDGSVLVDDADVADFNDMDSLNSVSIDFFVAYIYSLLWGN